MCLPAGLRQAFVTPDPLCAACLSNVEAGRIEEVESFVADTLGVLFRGLLQLDAALVPGACPACAARSAAAWGVPGQGSVPEPGRAGGTGWVYARTSAHMRAY